MNKNIKDKMIIIINGKGGVGKDTLIEGVKGEHTYINVSSIEPIKHLAKLGGWKGQKTKKDRLFLSDLKRIFYNYNKLSLVYLLKKTVQFFCSELHEILFVHIREPEQIKEYKEIITTKYPEVRNYTILIKKQEIDYHDLGNPSDDEVGNYNYDYIFNNNKTIDKSKQEFLLFIDSLLLNNFPMIDHLRDLDSIV